MSMTKSLLTADLVGFEKRGGKLKALKVMGQCGQRLLRGLSLIRRKCASLGVRSPDCHS